MVNTPPLVMLPVLILHPLKRYSAACAVVWLCVTVTLVPGTALDAPLTVPAPLGFAAFVMANAVCAQVASTYTAPPCITNVLFVTVSAAPLLFLVTLRLASR